MGRIRTIKPQFFEDEELSSLEAETHLLAAGLLCYSDDEGYFNANPALVKAAVFPLRETSVSIHGMLTQLSNIGFIRTGTAVDGKHYGQVVKFGEHQRVNRPTPSKIKRLEIVWDESVSTHGGLTEDSLQEGKGKEGKGKELNPSHEPTNRSCARNEFQLSSDSSPSAEIPDIPKGKAGGEKSKRKKSAPKKKADPRHHPFRGELERFWQELNPDLAPPEWNGADAGQLGTLLCDWKALTMEKFCDWLKNYAASRNINRVARPREFLPRIHRYARGPLDEYGKPMEEGGDGGGAAAAAEKAAQEQVLQDVFAYYVEQIEPEKRELTPAGRAKGLAQLKECFRHTADLGDAKEIMLRAIDGMAKDDRAMGRANGGQRHCDWETDLLPDFTRFEKWWQKGVDDGRWRPEWAN